MGTVSGNMVHLSFGTGSHFLLLRDQVEGQVQGAVVQLAGEFSSGAHRGRFSPTDGQLYVSGMNGWATTRLTQVVSSVCVTQATRAIASRLSFAFQRSCDSFSR